MIWNADYEIASAIFQAVFMVFYATKRHLPTRQNQYYMMAIIASFVTVTFDVLTAFANSYASQVPYVVLQALNMIFFMAVPVLSFSFFMYILFVTGQYKFVNSPIFIVFCLPAFISFLLAVATPFTGFLYYFDAQMNYVHGPCYGLEFLSNVFYPLVAVCFVTSFRKSMPKIQRRSIYFFCIALVGGAVVQGVFFNWVLMTNAVTSMALIVVYLSLQNPDMYIDKTSGLFNYDAFQELTKEYLLDGRMFSCICVSISDYHNMDVLYGSSNVEEAVLDVSAYLRKAFGRRRLFRFNSSRFLILEMGKGDYSEIEKAIHTRFEKPFAGATVDVKLDCTIVLLPYWHVPNEVSQVVNLLNFASRTESKENVTIEVNTEVIERMEHERAVERAIDHAIANNSIQMYYQPIYSTEKNKITSCEALARLFDDEIGFIRPDEFIAKAEENGSIVRLGEQIFEKVCIFLQEQNPENFGLESVHVNLSPAQCKQENLDEELARISEKYDIIHGMMDLELTESAAVEQNRTIRKNMDNLIAAGFTFSLDDYGTGYSNTAAIIQLPFKTVKIDKSLLWAYYDGRGQILPDLVSMFRNQELNLVVEGVETREMVDGLTAMGCHYLQGFYFSKPLPQREFIAYLRDYNLR